MHDAVCGEWQEDGDFFGHDIPGAGFNAVNREECAQRCRDTENCNAVTFKKYTSQCWLKFLPPDTSYGVVGPITDRESDTIALCPDEWMKGLTPLLTYKRCMSSSLSLRFVVMMACAPLHHTASQRITCISLYSTAGDSG
jgi:hypothetical protein